MVARQNDLICIAVGSSSLTAKTVHNDYARVPLRSPRGNLAGQLATLSK